METLKKDLQTLMSLSGSPFFDSKLLELKNTYTTPEERSFIYNFFLSDMESTHKAIKNVAKQLESIQIAEVV